MSFLMYIAAGVLIAASVAFVAIGTIYKWDFTSAAYAKWVRATGVIAVMALAGVAAWSRIMTPLIALAILVGGAALAVGYVLLHRWLSERLGIGVGAEDHRA